MNAAVDYRRVFECQLEQRLIVDLEGTVVAASERYGRATGKGEGAWIGQPLWKVPPFAADVRLSERARLALKTARQSRAPHIMQLLPQGEGEEGPWATAEVILVPDADGEASQFLVTLQPRAGGPRTENDRERRLRKIIEHSHDGLALFDAHGRPLFVSPAFRRNLGYAEDDPATPDPMIHIHPEDLRDFEEKVRALLDLPGGHTQTRVRVLHRSGAYHVYEVASWNLLHDPDVAAVVSYSHDVTEHVSLLEELRRTNEQLRMALSAARALSWTVDLDTQRGFWSENYFDYFQVSREDFERVGPLAAVHPRDRDEVLRAGRACLADGTAFRVDFRGLDRGNGCRWYATYGQVQKGERGCPTRFMGVTWDITERQRMQEERAALDQRMRDGQKLESLGVLAGGIAHDFNNLLMAILGNASLARGHTAPAGEMHLAQVEEAAQRASDLCKQMLAYAGKGRFVLASTNLNELIDQTTHLLQVSISKKAELRFHLDPDLPQIVVDPTQLRQVLMNLVINASEAMGSESGLISIGTGLVHADRTYLDSFGATELPAGRYVYLEVNDTGAGMSEETQARIFDPFFSTKFAGRGLGLAAVLGIVRGHKGALRVQSELGRGSRFQLLLPADTPGPQGSKTPPAGPRQTAQLSGTILVVDDEASVRAVAQQMLENMGFAVLLAHNGEQAVHMYQVHAHEVVAVLMDLTMPKMDGEEAFHELRKARADVRVLLMSGYNEQEAVARFVGKGLAGFIQKPFSTPELHERLQTLLRG